MDKALFSPSAGTRDVDIDYLIKDMSNLRLEANKHGVALASDLLDIVKVSRVGPKGTENAEGVNHAVGAGLMLRNKEVHALTDLQEAQQKAAEERAKKELDEILKKMEEAKEKKKKVQGDCSNGADKGGCVPEPPPH